MNQSVVDNLVEAIESGRSDIVRSVLSAYEKGKVCPQFCLGPGGGGGAIAPGRLRQSVSLSSAQLEFGSEARFR